MYNVCVVGATGNIGRKMVSLLEACNFPVRNLRLLASVQSAGQTLSFRGRKIAVAALEGFSFEGMDIALFSAGGKVSSVYGLRAVEAGCFVIDNSSYFRMDSEVPLVVPECNPEAVGGAKKRIIANPNCSTIQLVVALKPFEDWGKVLRVVVTTFQSVSGAGKRAMEILHAQTKDYLLEGEMKEKGVFPHQIAFNVLPQIGDFDGRGNTEEECKMVREIPKILGRDIGVFATCVRVPVFVGHCEAVCIEMGKEISVEEASRLLRAARGVVLADDDNSYATPLDVAEKDGVFVGRLRKDRSVKRGLGFWVVADNLRKGGALNAVEIAQLLVEKSLLRGR